MNAEQLANHLLKFLDANDRLLVNDFSQSASFNTLLNLKTA